MVFVEEFTLSLDVQFVDERTRPRDWAIEGHTLNQRQPTEHGQDCQGSRTMQNCKEVEGWPFFGTIRTALKSKDSLALSCATSDTLSV